MKKEVYKMKKSQIILILAIGILSLSITSASVQACRTDVNFRPIEDWLDNNPFGIGATWNAAYFGHDKNNYYWAWPDSPLGYFSGTPYEYEGYVKEKVLRDGSLEITVKLSVKDAYIELYHSLYDENGNPITTMEYFGDLGDLLGYAYCNYLFIFKFTLDAQYEGYEPWGILPGTREAGCPLPYYEAIMMIPEQLGIHVNSLMFIAMGEGEAFEPGWRWPAPGEEFPPWPDTIADISLFMQFHAKFRDGSNLEWPVGSSSFQSNTICYHVY